MKEYGFIRVGSAIPKVKISNVEYNVEEIKKLIKQAEKNGVEITLFPELSLTSISCGDLFFNTKLINDALNGLIELKKYTKKYKGIYVIGLPMLINNKLYNVSAVLQSGKILGIVPKYKQSRYFKTDVIDTNINIDNETVEVGNILFTNKNINFDITNNLTTSSLITLINEPTLSLVSKKNVLKTNLLANSQQYKKGIIYTANSALESTTDTVNAPLTYIIENGDILVKDEDLTFESKLIFNDLDIEKLINLRNKEINLAFANDNYKIISYNEIDTNNTLIREYNDTPFIPKDETIRYERCEEILNTQSYALARRLEATGIKSCVLGISGGLDSTLAFIVTVKAFDILKLDRKDIIGITLPGFGTTNRTYTNACELVKNYGATLKEISIKDACIQHFKDIEHDINVTDITYENSQARERTQILLDYANKVNGLVVGTGDLSELVLGWCTYNGDHMSNYAVNASIPKTLVRHLTEHFANKETNKLAKQVLLDILATPVSPELLPPNESGEIAQITENSVGPYHLHDFFIYHFLTYGASPSKLYYLAKHTFKMEETEIKKWLRVFINRFFTQQFKRSCSVDGAKVGNISLSPRGDLTFPSDANREAYLKEIDNL